MLKLGGQGNLPGTAVGRDGREAHAKLRWCAPGPSRAIGHIKSQIFEICAWGRAAPRAGRAETRRMGRKWQREICRAQIVRAALAPRNVRALHKYFRISTGICGRAASRDLTPPDFTSLANYLPGTSPRWNRGAVWRPSFSLFLRPLSYNSAQSC